MVVPSLIIEGRPPVETIIVSSSRSSHGNTQRIAEAIGEVLHAKVIAPADASADLLLGAHRVGFGSGIYNMSFDRTLRDLVADLPDMTGRQAFVFSTSGLPETALRRYTPRFTRLLEGKGFEVTGRFSCRGLDTWGPFGLVGGVSKGRPDAHDLDAAQAFAVSLATDLAD